MRPKASDEPTKLQSVLACSYLGSRMETLVPHLVTDGRPRLFDPLDQRALQDGSGVKLDVFNTKCDSSQLPKSGLRYIIIVEAARRMNCTQFAYRYELQTALHSARKETKHAKES